MNRLLSTASVLAEAVMEPRLFDLDFQLLADALLTIIAVFALFLIMSYFLFNPARAFLQKRQEKIKTQLDDAEANQEKANALREEYEAKLKNINKEAEEILSEARKKALANENRIIAEAKEEAAAILERARQEADLEKQRIADEVKKEIVSVAALMAGKVVASSIDVQIQDGLIDETLKEIGDSTWLS
ncbi:MAG: F0F1 ATP synthase subunit B [Lachnospiraceae bacterium]